MEASSSAFAEEQRFAQHVRRGLACRAGGELEEAAREFAAACTLRSGRPGVHCELALTYEKAGKREKALESYQAALACDPRSARALVGLGHCWRLRGNSGEARDCLRRALAQDPTNVGANIEFGHLLRQCGEYEAALAAFRRAADLRPEHTGARLEIAALLLLLDRADEAASVYRELLAADPQSSSALLGLSRAAQVMGLIPMAEEFARRARALPGQALAATLRLCELAREDGRLDQAQETAAWLLKRHPGDPRVFVESGKVLRLRGNREHALAMFEHAVELGSENALLEVAAELVAIGRPQPAAALYARILARLPGAFEARMGLARLYMRTAQFEACVRECDALIAAYPSRLPPYGQKCHALIRLDRGDEAWEIVCGLMEPGFDRGEVEAMRLEISRLTGRTADLREAMRNWRRESSKSFNLWFQGTMALIGLCELEAAVEALREAPARRPQERSRVQLLAGLLAEQHWRVPEALSLLGNSLAGAFDGAATHQVLGRLHFLCADAERAADHLRRYLEGAASAFSLQRRAPNPSVTLLGQLINELRLDTGLARRLARLQAREAHARVSRLLALVRAHPFSTPAAIYLLLALRQVGAFANTRGKPTRGASAESIPRSIVQYWDRAEPPQAVSGLMRGWASAHPGYRYRRFDDESARAWLAENYPPPVFAAYRRSGHAAQACDLFRLAYLFREGGYYVDADDRCVGCLDTLAVGAAQLVVCQEQYASLGNNFLACAPGERMVGIALEQAVASLLNDDTSNVWLDTGPGLLTRVFAQALARRGVDWTEEVEGRLVLERRDLAGISNANSHLNYKHTRQSWLGVAAG